MRSTRPGRDGPGPNIRGSDLLAEMYFDTLERWGAETRAQDPLVRLSAPGTGRAVHRTGETLAGYCVRSLFFDSWVLGEQDFSEIGFDEAAQIDGLWVINGLDERQEHGHWCERWRGDTTYAHFGAAGWTVVRSLDGLGEETPWADRWSAPTTRLGDREHEAIVRVAEQTAFLRDAARLLGDDAAAYRRFWKLIDARSRAAGGVSAANVAAVRGGRRSPVPPDIAALFAPEVERLGRLAPSLYRALRGEAPTLRRSDGGTPVLVSPPVDTERGHPRPGPGPGGPSPPSL